MLKARLFSKDYKKFADDTRLGQLKQLSLLEKNVLKAY